MIDFLTDPLEASIVTTDKLLGLAHLKNFNLSNPYTGERHPYIGADFYWSFIEDVFGVQ